MPFVINDLLQEHLKKEETDLMMEKDRLERERNLHIREMRRIQSEEQSRYRNHELLNERYLLLSLLGKGGFRLTYICCLVIPLYYKTGSK